MKPRPVAMALVVAWATAAAASPLLLADNNTTLCIDPDSKHGIASWRVDGVNCLAKQWFWLRFEEDGREQPLDRLGLVAAQLTDTNTLIDPRDDTLTAWYGDLDAFYIQVRLAVHGGLAGSGASDVTEQIAFHNPSGEPVTLSFFQYADLDLGRAARDDTIIIGDGTVLQTDPGRFVCRTVVTPAPLRCQAAHWWVTLRDLCDDGAIVLNDDAGPRAGDVTWTSQWNLDIPAGGSMQINRGSFLVPEPATISLLALGAASLSRRRR